MSSLLNLEDFYKTETGIGFMAEDIVAKKLGGKHLVFNNKGLDIQVGNQLIDVKSAHLNRRKNKRGKPVIGQQKGYWNFKGWGLNTPDFFVCVAFGDDNKPVKILKIPSNEYPKQGITVGQVSKYDKYII